MFLRLEGNIVNAYQWAAGSEIASFGGVEECIPYWTGAGYSGEEAIAIQQQAVEDFFRFIVNPMLYHWNNPEDPDGCDPVTTDPDQMYPLFALKKIDKIAEGDVFNEYNMTIMDLISAIDE